MTFTNENTNEVHSFMKMKIFRTRINKGNLRHSERTARTMSRDICKTDLNIKSRTKRYKLTTDTSWKLHNLAQSCTIITMVVLVLLSRITTAITTKTAITSTANSHITWTTPTTPPYNEPFTPDDDGFRPIIPKDISPEYISRNVFTETGQYRVFAPIDSDLRATTQIANRKRKLQQSNWIKLLKQQQNSDEEETEEGLGEEKTMAEHEKVEINPIKRVFYIDETENQKLMKNMVIGSITKTKQPHDTNDNKQNKVPNEPTLTTMPEKQNHEPTLGAELKSLEDLLIEYVENFFTKGQYEPLPGLVIELQKNHTFANETTQNVTQTTTTAADAVNLVRTVRHTNVQTQRATPDGNIRINIPRALQTGRLLFFTGLKKILWPIWVGLQILKSLLFAMFLPSLIGSFGKLVGKGIASASIRPMEAPQDLDFRDNSFNFDEENNKFIINDDGGKDGGYAYNQPAASQTNYAYNVPAGVNNQVLSRYGINEKQHVKMPDSYLSALQSISSASFKNSNSISGSFSQGGTGGGDAAAAAITPVRPKPAAANLNNFQTFQKVPASSLLLSNYDPFYSPLLSRLDSVFAQLKLNSENEVCREKLICLMYANPAKYAPYSNLVSAQLSRELNELRKPTSDNPDILRFFKYMRAAKDGQDGIDCEENFDKCKEFKDFENPAMVSTYHDINKLVQARKMT